MTAKGPEAQWWYQSGQGNSHRPLPPPNPTPTLHPRCTQTEESAAKPGRARAGPRHSLQADVRGQLEGVLQYVELLDLPRLPRMNSSCYLKGPGVPLLSRTGLQEVLRGCLSLQLNEELWEDSQSDQAGKRMLAGQLK